MTEAIYLEVSEKTDAAMKANRQVSVSGMLKILGVSRSGYRAWQNRMPSNTQQRREAVKVKIMDIYDDSKQNYGAPKITKRLQQEGEIISERTVGKYMSQLGIKAQWVKPWTVTTKIPISTMNFKIYLMSNSTRNVQMLCGVVTLHISGRRKASYI